MGDVSVVESAVTRQLQHAILQLCNEHVSYEHTLQVLGVVCVTVDDRPRDVVVKLNNTLKRVDAVTPVTDNRRVGSVRASAPTLWPRVASDVDVTAACSSSTAAGSSTAGYTDHRQGTAACTEAAPVATVLGNSSLRKCHGRKQSNPVRVKTVLDDDDNDDDHDYSVSDHRDGVVLLIAPAEPSAVEDHPNTVSSPSSSARILRSVGGQHRDVDEDLHQRRWRHAETPTLGVSESSVVRPLLTGIVGKSDVNQDVSVDDGVCTSRPALSSSSDLTECRPSDSAADKLSQDCASADVQQAALNFSTRTPDHVTDSDRSPSCVADVKIKDEVQHPALSMTYGLEMGGRRGGTLDMSRSMTAAAAAAAAFSQYVDDPTMLQSLTSYDQQRLALYTSLVTAAAATGVPPAGCDDEQPPSMSLNGAGPDGADLPSSSLDRSLAMSSYAMTARLGDGLMHRLPAIRRQERFGRGLHHQPPMKVRVSTVQCTSPNTNSLAWR